MKRSKNIVITAAAIAVLSIFTVAQVPAVAGQNPVQITKVVKIVKTKIGPRGPRGKTGPQGPAGPQGPEAVPNITIRDRVATVPVATLDGSNNLVPAYTEVTETCPEGTQPIAATFDIGLEVNDLVVLHVDTQKPTRSGSLLVANKSRFHTHNVQLSVTCEKANVSEYFNGNPL